MQSMKTILFFIFVIFAAEIFTPTYGSSHRMRKFSNSFTYSAVKEMLKVSPVL